MADETWYTFGPVPVYDSRPGAADTIVQNGTGGKLVLVKDGAALPIRDLNGTPIDQITSNADGQSVMFLAQTLYGLVQFGDIVNPAWAVEVGGKLASQDQVLAAAQQAVTAAQDAVTAAQAGSGSGGGVTAVNDSSSTSTTAPLTAAATKTAIAGLLTSSSGIEQAQDIIGAMVAAAGGSYNDATGAITFPSSGGGTAGVTTDSASTSSTLAPSAATTRSMIGKQGPVKMLSAYGAAGTNGYTSIQTPTDADSATVVANKMASNLAILNAAIADANGVPIDGGPDPVALNGDLNYPAGDLKLNLLHWRGKTTNLTGGEAARPIKPALRILNAFGSEMVGDLLVTQVGPTNPVANVTTHYGGSGFQLPAVGGTGQDNQGGYRSVRASDVVVVYCKDAMPAAGQTGLVNTASAATWRAEQTAVHGIGLNVASVNLTGSGTTVGGGYPYQSLERHVIRGALSGVTALANSWAVDQAAGTSGKLIFGSVPGDFRNGENLIDDATGNVIGVAGTMFVVFSGRLLWDYFLSVRMATANAVTAGTWTSQQITDARPRMRVMNKAKVTLDITVKASHDVDTFLTTDERNVPAVELDGLYCPTIRMTTLSAYSRALLVRSCEAPDISLPSVTGVANHAIPVAAANGEEAYGYGVELRGTTRYAKVHDSHGRFLRHLFTTNPNSRTWGSTSADGIPDYMDMGAGSMYATVRDSTASECYSAPFDTHEMAWGTRWRNLDVFSSYSGSRVVTAPAGYNTRGWADDYQDCRVNGTVGGFSNGGVALTSGVPYVTIYRGIKAKDIQTTALSFSPFNSGLNQDQSGLLASQQSAAVMHGTVVIDNPDVQMDSTITTTQGLQFAISCDVGQFVWQGGGRIGGFNRAPVRIKAGGVHRIIEPPLADYTGTQSSPFGWQLDGTSYLEVWAPLKFIRRTASVPPAPFNDVSGSSTIWWTGALHSDSSVTATTAPAARLAAFAAAKAGAGSATIQAMSPTF